MTEKTAVTADITLLLDALGNGSDTGITVGRMIVPRDVVLAFINAARKGAGAPWPREGAARGHWPIRAANACFAINRDNPEKVAAEIVEAFKRLHEIRDAFKAAALEVTSWNVGGGSDLPPWPWHEEWFSRADALLSRLGATNGS